MGAETTTRSGGRGFTRRSVVGAMAASLTWPFAHNAEADRGVGLISGQGTIGQASAPVGVGADSSERLLVKSLRPPEFRRYPPHRPSARHAFLGGLDKYQGKTEDVLLLDVQENLLDLGYPPALWFSLPDGGTALASSFERIDDSYASVIKNRFNSDLTYDWSILGRRPVPRRLRAIVFFLSSTRIQFGPMPVSFRRHQDALQKGIAFVGNGMRFSSITERHQLTAFIYEYFSEDEAEPVAVESRMRGEEQLKVSGIIPKLS